MRKGGLASDKVMKATTAGCDTIGIFGRFSFHYGIRHSSAIYEGPAPQDVTNRERWNTIRVVFGILVGSLHPLLP